MMRRFSALSWLLIFALVCGFPLGEILVVSRACAEEQESAPDESSPEDDTGETAEDETPEGQTPQDDTEENTEAESSDADTTEDDPPAASDSKSESNKKAATDKETSQDSEQDPPADEPAEAETEDAPVEEKSAPAKKKREKEPTDQKEAAATTDEESTNEQQAADEAEEAKAAEAEAAGAEVEIDESDDEEEEPDESEEVVAKPVTTEAEPVKPTPISQKRIIGATATIMEKQSELLFRARVDSGAKSCSLHIEDYKIENESDNMAENIGKVVRFHIKNGNRESHWLEAKIAGYVIVKTAAHRERRYKVPLTLRYKDFEKTVLVTLNNREKMQFPLLLGRNFLVGDFVVDVELDNDELQTQ